MDQNTTELVEQNTAKKGSFFSSLYDYIELFVIALVVMMLILCFVTRVCVVDGSSMEKTLSNHEVVLCHSINYEPQRGDIIVFHQTGSSLNDEALIKRVIGLPGDEITLVYSPIFKVFINGVELEESYAYYDPLAQFNDKYYAQCDYPSPFIVPEGHLFVMGDNRYHSTDSRKANYVGFVDDRRVLGKVYVRLFPFSKFGGIKEAQ